MKRKRQKASERAAAIATWGAAMLAFAALLFLIGFILVRGVPHLSLSMLAPRYTSENASLLPALVSTVIITALSLLIALPLGVFTAVYLAEYARRGSFAVRLVRAMADTLSGIPSILYGLFGMLFFVTALHWGFSVLAGACTMSMMLLPLVMRASEEAIRSVPDMYREGAFGLGAGRLRTVFRIVLPTAKPGILAGVILAIGRCVGESAALIYTAGTVAQIPFSPLQSARTLAVHMYSLSNEGLHTDKAYATAVVLMALVAGINALAAWLTRRMGRQP
ncbi:MAG: phosphate ABC transporter permease PstA [Oscillospiraceae bacterium]|jgi:phosphate transport system permease protein|nr:phosphate ABC transporter permease PstA [Oscillospiraceae bacterium]